MSAPHAVGARWEALLLGSLLGVLLLGCSGEPLPRVGATSSAPPTGPTPTGPTLTGPTLTVSGVVRSAPTCPVEIVGTPCPPRAVAGALVQALVGERQVRAARTDSTGRYHLDLTIGTYTLRASTTGTLPVPESVPLTLTGSTTQDFLLDSGIR